MSTNEDTDEDGSALCVWRAGMKEGCSRLALVHGPRL